MVGLRSFNCMIKRTFSLHAKPVQFPPSQFASPIPQHELIDEETYPAYNPKYVYPAKPGEILANHYQLLVKIGWGTRSTTWLAKDIKRFLWHPDRFVALKIINNRSSLEAYHERDIEEHISRQSPIHRGRGIIRTCLDSFEVTGPDGSHLCLAYEPMREPLWILQKRFVDQRLPLPVAKAYLLILLAGLDYLHSECRLVHTDLKLDNILMTFENEGILPKFIKEHVTNLPMQCKTNPTSGRTIYRCHNDFGPLDWKELRKMLPKIVDFGLATRLESNSQGQVRNETVGFHPIQPDHYRAPEVILGCPWSFSADIWNIGVLAWNIIEHTELFLHVHDSQGHYNPKTHLAEMIALLGPPPKELLAKSDAMAEFSWSNPIMNETGRLCRNGREYFNGPFFNENGEFLYDDLIPARKLEDSILYLEQKERQAFLSFITLMLAWHPEDRQTAGELMKHPFLNG
ncbi:kinase-like domain-containing protein [Aspergillus recurvatus]